MITVEQLYAKLHSARISGVLKGSDVLVKSPRTGNLAVIRNTVYSGHIDLDTGEITVYDTKIRGASPQYIVVDEISAFLEGRPDVADTGHKRDEDVTGPSKPYIQRGEGI